MRFYCGGLRSVHACYTFLLERFAFGSRLSFFLCQEKRDGLRCLAFLFRRVEIAIRAFSNRRFDYQFSPPVHFRPERFFMAIPTGNEETRERGERSRRRGARALLREHIGFAMFSEGSTLGQNAEAALRPRPQTCAKETRLPGLSSFDSWCGCVSRGEGRSGATET